MCLLLNGSREQSQERAVEDQRTRQGLHFDDEATEAWPQVLVVAAVEEPGLDVARKAAAKAVPSTTHQADRTQQGALRRPPPPNQAAAV